MALVEKTQDAEQALTSRIVEIELWPDSAELLDDLIKRSGLTASELMPYALGAFWRELEGIVLPPPEASEDINEVIRQSEEDILAGRTIPHEQVTAEARKIVGG